MRKEEEGGGGGEEEAFFWSAASDQRTNLLHPCPFIKLLVRACLGCLGLTDSKSEDDGAKNTGKGLGSSTSMNSSRRPRRPRPDPGNPGQIN
ncbi:hypothetical protein AXF42_Ash017880 [Apostasia shenzhenica]|uniref:Uncharacterized protein n=1 Tax=Apostasia shenzhenica TaxID=1088818 RepID=A0A2I0AY61_9ASPA|nr:hypothetical protein AXF42_Ash017880 [Apostasia shenzhenica]